MDVADFSCGQRGSEGIRVELRIAARFRDGADVEELPDTLSSQEIE